MMGSERVVGTRSADEGSDRVSGIVPQSLVELFRLIEERLDDRDGCEGGGGQENGGGASEAWTVRVGYLQVFCCCVFQRFTWGRVISRHIVRTFHLFIWRSMQSQTPRSTAGRLNLALCAITIPRFVAQRQRSPSLK